MTTKEVRVKAGNMLSIFSGVNIVHPYRFQPYVTLTVPYQEYKAFVELMVQLGFKCLVFSPEYYKDAIDNNRDETLRRYYLNDLSKAVMNELCLAGYEKEGTCIWHEFEDYIGPTLSLESIKSELSDMPSDCFEKAMQTLLVDSKGLDVRRLSSHNQTLWYYALYLKCAAYAGSSTIKNIDRE